MKRMLIGVAEGVEFLSESLGRFRREVGDACAVVVAHHAHDDLHAAVLKRFEIFLAVVEQMLHVGVGEEVDTAGFGVVVDVAGEHDHGVDHVFARILQCEAQVVERVGVVDFHAGDLNAGGEDCRGATKGA